MPFFKVTDESAEEVLFTLVPNEIFQPERIFILAFLNFQCTTH